MPAGPTIAGSIGPATSSRCRWSGGPPEGWPPGRSPRFPGPSRSGTPRASAALRFLPIPASGFAVTAAALGLLLLAAHGILRQMGLSRLPAAGGACLLLLSLTVQQAAVATHGELLSAALQCSGFWVAGVAGS